MSLDCKLRQQELSSMNPGRLKYAYIRNISHLDMGGIISIKSDLFPDALEQALL